MCSQLKISATNLVFYQFCFSESVSSFLFSATGRQLHVPGQPRSGWAYLPAMRGKPPFMYDNLSFFSFFSKLQSCCHRLIVRHSFFYHWAAVKEPDSLSQHPSLLILHISLSLCYCKGNHTPTWIHINTGLPVRHWAVKHTRQTHGHMVLCVTTETALVGILIYFLFAQQNITFICDSNTVPPFLLLWWTQEPSFHCVIN